MQPLALFGIGKIKNESSKISTKTTQKYVRNLHYYLATVTGYTSLKKNIYRAALATTSLLNSTNATNEPQGGGAYLLPE